METQPGGGSSPGRRPAPARAGGSGGSEPVPRVLGPLGVQHSSGASLGQSQGTALCHQRPLMSRRAHEPTQPRCGLRGQSQPGYCAESQAIAVGRLCGAFLGSLMFTCGRASGPPWPALGTASPLALGWEWGQLCRVGGQLFPAAAQAGPGVRRECHTKGLGEHGGKETWTRHADDSHWKGAASAPDGDPGLWPKH